MLATELSFGNSSHHDVREDPVMGGLVAVCLVAKALAVALRLDVKATLLVDLHLDAKALAVALRLDVKATLLVALHLVAGLPHLGKNSLLLVVLACDLVFCQ